MYLLTIDIGNTTIGIGVCQNKKVVYATHIRIDKDDKDAAHYVKVLKDLLGDFQLTDFCGSILSSVVPELNETLLAAMETVLQKPARLVTLEDIRKMLPVKVKSPDSVGKDRLMDCIGAKARFPKNKPFAVIDMGTATTVNVVDKNGAYVGGMIIPGLGTSVRALSARASQLPEIELKAPKHWLGQNTVECMQSGAIYGFACMIDGIIERLQCEYDKDIQIILTGGNGKRVRRYCNKRFTYDANLIMKGLAYIYDCLYLS